MPRPSRRRGSEKRNGETPETYIAEVRGDVELSGKAGGRGPKCDINFSMKRDTGTMGLICGDCSSQTERCQNVHTEACSRCNRSVDADIAEVNPMIRCTQQKCRSKELIVCRDCCVRTFNDRHYYQFAYQPEGFVPLEWQGFTVEQWKERTPAN